MTAVVHIFQGIPPCGIPVGRIHHSGRHSASVRNWQESVDAIGQNIINAGFYSTNRNQILPVLIFQYLLAYNTSLIHPKNSLLDSS